MWPDPTLRLRLEELLAIVRDKICVEPGAMNLYFTNRWHPIPGHDSYGHDVETAFLMLETDEALHHKANEKTECMARMLVDHALAYGWDTQNGGFFREGTTFGNAEDTMKEWWVQMEGLNALLMMHERYGKQDAVYFQRFLEQWSFIQHCTIDDRFHGDFNMTKTDGTPVTQDKNSIWKAAYHDGGAFWNVRDRPAQTCRRVDTRSMGLIRRFPVSANRLVYCDAQLSISILAHTTTLSNDWGVTCR